jgi:hypothetical protein
MTSQSPFEEFPRSRRQAGPRGGVSSRSGSALFWRRATATTACAFVFASVTACAVAGPHNPDNLALDQLAQIGRICETVIRVPPGEAHYVGCVESLSSSMRSLGHDRTMERARVDCLDRGLKLDSPALAECVLKLSDMKPDSSGLETPAPAISGTSELEQPGSSKSYFYASPRDVHRRVQLSCARLGFDPGSGGFGGCVASLQAALFAADNPMH